MQTKDAGGFTIIEVTIFLAITALMITIALAGTGNSINAARFTDSMRSFESFMQRQFDETLNGVNTRPATVTCTNGIINTSVSSNPGQSNSCLLLGKYVHFIDGGSSVRVYPIVGTDPGHLDATDGDAAAIIKAKPHIVQGFNTEEFDIPWEAQVHGSRRSDGKSINSIAMIRSPRSANVYSYSFSASNPDTMSPEITSLISAPGVHGETYICIKNRDALPKYGAVTLAQNARGQDSISSKPDIRAADVASLCEGTP